MTIGIAAFGPNAGGAVLAAWAAAEATGTGAIGGFAVFTVLTNAEGPASIQCQRGGLAGLRKRSLAQLEDMSNATVAAVITSGPDRPLPLTQFLAAGEAGLVTGHRLPNLAGVDHVPVNIAVLRLIQNGASPEDAVAQVCRANPILDAGLIAVTRDAIGLAETIEVQKRDDKGQLIIREKGRALALLHNSITPVTGFAEYVAQAGMAAFS